MESLGWVGRVCEGGWAGEWVGGWAGSAVEGTGQACSQHARQSARSCYRTGEAGCRQPARVCHPLCKGDAPTVACVSTSHKAAAGCLCVSSCCRALLPAADTWVPHGEEYRSCRSMATSPAWQLVAWWWWCCCCCCYGCCCGCCRYCCWWWCCCLAAAAATAAAAWLLLPCCCHPAAHPMIQVVLPRM
jgi:hypothetical protein